MSVKDKQGLFNISPVLIVHRSTYVKAGRLFTAKYSIRKSTALPQKQLSPQIKFPRASYHAKARTLSISTKTIET